MCANSLLGQWLQGCLGCRVDVESDLLVLEIGICTPCHEYNDALLMALLSCTVRAVWPCKGRASATQPVVLRKAAEEQEAILVAPKNVIDGNCLLPTSRRNTDITLSAYTKRDTTHKRRSSWC